MDGIGFVGTPLEKMVLMLNDKIDLLHDRIDGLDAYVRSEEPAIPWAHHPDGYAIPTPVQHEPPPLLHVWEDRGWDVWRVTMPSEPSDVPHYKIVEKGASLPTEGPNMRRLMRERETDVNAYARSERIVRTRVSGPASS
ncbi:hypothetical protein WJX74_004045 [Apatococcus lobatus]|uniref:Uncharacterized protein n=1 Tax=Apatococcus lobatus TaxID=904363 RepID=A0AAW1Q1F2_9CHLO